MARDHTRLLLPLLLLALAAPAGAQDVTVTPGATGGFVVEDNTGAIERLRVDEATGNVSRNGALFVHTTGTDNTFVGEGAGNTATTGIGKNSAFGKNALSANTTGSTNSAFGEYALGQNVAGFANSAFGAIALSNNEGSRNSAFGSAALVVNTTGNQNAALGYAALLSNTAGSSNSAFGAYALRNNTASDNSAFGHNALLSNTSGIGNVAVGSGALASVTVNVHNTAVGFNALTNSTGSNNSAFGYKALSTQSLGSAFENSAFGDRALANNTAARNSAFGQAALYDNAGGANNAAFGDNALSNNTSGSNNTAVGKDAGVNQDTGSDNIYIGNQGVAAESGKIKIGNSTHTETFIEGIDGNTATGGVAVLINSSNELHTLVSSARFKESVADMGESSQVIQRLRPVTFLYREDAGGDGRTPEYGLIAEEVAEIAPELVVHDADGDPYSVRYHVLTPMLLNELQKERRTNREQQQVIVALSSRLEAIEQQLAVTTAGPNR